jgi:hypothetical protein
MGVKVLLTVLETCKICSGASKLGVHLFDAFICDECEQVIVHLDVKHPLYPFLMSKMNEILQMDIMTFCHIDDIQN